MESKIEELLDRYEDATERGEQVSVEELCVDHPELVNEVARRIEQLKKSRWLDQPIEHQEEEAIPATPQEAGLPSCLGRYRLDELIGAGGFGQVWKGYDPDLKRVVAIKVPRPDLVQTDERSQQFFEEAQRIARLRHPGIVPVFDVGRQDGRVFLVSDFIDGQNLAQFIRDGGQTANESARIISAVAEALQHAHDEGFVHQDVKPANILLNSDGVPFLTDFGIAATVDELRLTPARHGTVNYMSPEQAAGGDVDARSDIFSLGIVLFEMLAGSPDRSRPYPKKTPLRLKRVCEKCLALDRDKRFQSASELSTALKRPKRTWWLWALPLALLCLLLSLKPHVEPVAAVDSKGVIGHAGNDMIRAAVTDMGTNGELSIIGHDDGTIVVRTNDGKTVNEFNQKSPVTSVAANPSLSVIAWGDEQGRVHVQGNMLSSSPKTLNVLTDSVVDLSISPDGGFLVAGSAKGELVAWKLDSSMQSQPLTNAPQQIRKIQFLSDGQLLIGMSDGNEQAAIIHRYQLNKETSQIHATAQTTMDRITRTTSFGFSSDGKHVLTACEGIGVVVWEIDNRTYEQKTIFANHHHSVHQIELLSDSRVATTDESSVLKIWQIDDGIQVLSDEFDKPITAVTATEEGVLLGFDSGESKLLRGL